MILSILNSIVLGNQGTEYKDILDKLTKNFSYEMQVKESEDSFKWYPRCCWNDTQDDSQDSGWKSFWTKTIQVIIFWSKMEKRCR